MDGKGLKSAFAAKEHFRLSEKRLIGNYTIVRIIFNISLFFSWITLNFVNNDQIWH